MKMLTKNIPQEQINFLKLNKLNGINDNNY